MSDIQTLPADRIAKRETAATHMVRAIPVALTDTPIDEVIASLA